MRETENTARLLGGRYRLGGYLGGGGMADVYRAMDVRLQRVVAVKVFRSGVDATGRQRFEEEARMLAGLHHPGLVPVFDSSAGDGDELFLVMQLVEGHTLADAIAQGPMPPQEVQRLGRELSEVLDYVHESGIIHRDVKPSNVLISHDSRVFLADFGVSRLTDAVGRLTSSGIVGTATYMAPEQVRGSESTFPLDVYSLGLVLLECATGRVEYPGTGVETAMARLARPPHVPGDLPEPLVSTLRAMTATDPAQRPSARECAALLGGEQAAAPTIRIERSPVDDAPTQPGTRLYPMGAQATAPARGRWRLAAGGAAALAVLAGLLVFWPSGTPERPPEPTLPPASGPAGVQRLPADLANLERLVQE